MDDDSDMIRIIERRGAPIEGGIVDVPFRRSDPPNELGKIAPVFVVAGPPALRGKIKLVPPLQLSAWWQTCKAFGHD